MTKRARIGRVVGLLSGLAWAAVLSASLSVPAWAQEPSRPANIVNGHRFPPSVIFRDPFIGTETLLSMAGALSSPSITFAGQPRELDLAAFSPQILGQFKVTDRFSLLLNFTGSATSGLNTQSAILYGATVNYSYGIGFKFGLLPRQEKWDLTFVADATKFNSLAVSPLTALGQRAVNFAVNGSFERNDRSLTRWRPEVRFAYAFTPALGAQARAGVTIDAVTDADDQSTGTLGLQASLNLNPWIKVPMALAANYVHDEGFSDQGARNLWSIILTETVNDPFTFAFEIGRAYVPEIDVTVFGISARYYY